MRKRERGGATKITAVLRMSEFEVKLCEEHYAQMWAACEMRLLGIIASSNTVFLIETRSGCLDNENIMCPFSSSLAPLSGLVGCSLKWKYCTQSNPMKLH